MLNLGRILPNPLWQWKGGSSARGGKPCAIFQHVTFSGELNGDDCRPYT
jgi:hypothetical protein